MELSKPVIAVVSGHCVAGGLELALWCDLRLCDTSAVFGVFCRRVGVPLIDGGCRVSPLFFASRGSGHVGECAARVFGAGAVGKGRERESECVCMCVERSEKNQN